MQAVPREGAGRTIQLVSDLRGTGEEAGAWETSTPYESLLVTISQAVRGGKLPAGWYQVPVTKETLQAPAGLSSVADSVWTGNHLKMVRFVGLGPTHRAVGEMRSAGVDAQTLASFLHDTQLQQRSGETPDFSNTLFLLDESSMVGNTDMARAYALIAAGGGRAVASGDTDQLQAIAPGQPFRLQQTRSAADVAIMKEIVRQTPELREAVYSLINRDVERALSGLESVKPSQVPRLEGAWAPEHSVTEFSHSQEAKLAEAQQKAMLKGETFPDVPMTLYEAIVRDYTGRTPEAREQTLIVTHLNEDRRVLNSMIHDAREKAGELGKEQVMVPVLNTANIRDGELRRL
ncbi:AAA family ATPase, partial [Escherichia coli]|nr:AAA family ATPase [Escherichia coli]